MSSRNFKYTTTTYTHNILPDLYLKIITRTPFCLNISWFTWIAFKLLSKPSDMNIYSSLISRILIAPDRLKQFFSAINLAVSSDVKNCPFFFLLLLGIFSRKSIVCFII